MRKPRAPEDQNSEQQPQNLVWPPPRPDLPKSNTVWPPPQNPNSTGYRGDPDAPELMRPDNVDITTVYILFFLYFFLFLGKFLSCSAFINFCVVPL